LYPACSHHLLVGKLQARLGVAGFQETGRARSEHKIRHSMKVAFITPRFNTTDRMGMNWDLLIIRHGAVQVQDLVSLLIKQAVSNL